MEILAWTGGVPHWMSASGPSFCSILFGLVIFPGVISAPPFYNSNNNNNVMADWSSKFATRPINQQHRTRSTRDTITQNGVSYLTQFGYLPRSETESLFTDQQVRDAVRNLQFMAGLNVTGELDPVTLDIMRRPRCGVPDVTHTGYRNRRSVRLKRYSLQGQRWSKTNLTWNLQKGPSSGLDHNLARRELSYALELWARESSLTFQEVNPGDDRADISVFFHRGFHGDGYQFDGQGSVLAHAFFPGSGRGGDVHFDDDERWSEHRATTQDFTSLFAVAAHEFGHSLGLSHSGVEGALMYPWYSGVPDDYRLPEDDRKAVQILYGKTKSQYPAYPDISNEIPTPGPTYPTKGRDGPRSKGQNDEDDMSHGNTPPRGDDSYNEDGENSAPVRCGTDFDAVAIIRTEMWAFKGRYFWRIDREGGTRDDPTELTSFWYGLPSDIEKIDAVYERTDHKIVFFVANHYYILNGNSQLDEGPIPLTRLGLPAELERVDAAFIWGWNDKTYFFSDTMYWRFDEEIHHVELDYPRDISIWNGVPYQLDAAFQFTDGKTYFFKEQSFWEFDDRKMSVTSRQGTRISEFWMHCPKEIKDPFQSGVSGSQRAATFPPLFSHKMCLCSMFLILIHARVQRN